MSFFSQLGSRPPTIHEQVCEALAAQDDSPRAAESIDHLTKIFWRNRRFVLDSQVPKGHSRTSCIQDYGTYLVEIDSGNRKKGTV